ncbi:hypothetical protein [Streptomyces sp. BA2]|uniref:hypothetical protein n=1 Tax=Streptomyces sp. BA2 TaxID=436595 RepID=UPI001328FAA2|nr:hypothetical protein [Streptomyces sp. BA2]MWA14319.1 hypothetical protein [Streptomyces sp. BA2]
MIKDPSTSWDGGPYPYDALAEVGVTPGMSHADLQDVSFELLARRLMTPATQQAWDELRVVRRRMVAELLLYDVDLPSELPAADAALDAALAVRESLGREGPPPQTLPEEIVQLLDDLITFDI